MKTESVYPGHWEERTRDEVLALVGDCIRWHDHERIKRSLGWMRPFDADTAKERLHDHLQENVRSPLPLSFQRNNVHCSKVTLPAEYPWAI